MQDILYWLIFVVLYFSLLSLTDNQIWQIELSVSLESWIRMQRERENTRIKNKRWDDETKATCICSTQTVLMKDKIMRSDDQEKDRKKQRRSDKSDIFASTLRLYTRVFHYLLDYTIVISFLKKCLHRWRQTWVIYIYPSISPSISSWLYIQTHPFVTCDYCSLSRLLLFIFDRIKCAHGINMFLFECICWISNLLFSCKAQTQECWELFLSNTLEVREGFFVKNQIHSMHDFTHNNGGKTVFCVNISIYLFERIFRWYNEKDRITKCFASASTVQIEFNKRISINNWSEDRWSNSISSSYRSVDLFIEIIRESRVIISIENNSNCTTSQVILSEAFRHSIDQLSIVSKETYEQLCER